MLTRRVCGSGNNEMRDIRVGTLNICWIPLGILEGFLRCGHWLPPTEIWFVISNPSKLEMVVLNWLVLSDHVVVKKNRVGCSIPNHVYVVNPVPSQREMFVVHLNLWVFKNPLKSKV